MTKQQKLNQAARAVADAYCSYVYEQHCPTTSTATRCEDVRDAKMELDRALVAYKALKGSTWEYV